MSLIGIADRIAAKQTAPAFFTKDSAAGDTIIGVVKAASFRQSRDFSNNKAEFWEDGTEKEQLAILVNDSALVDEAAKDNGDRMVYVKWWGEQSKAFAAAILASGSKDLEVGGTFTVTYTGLGEPKKKGDNAPKLYTFDYTAAR